MTTTTITMPIPGF